jgi:hypothetical protein
LKAGAGLFFDKSEECREAAIAADDSDTRRLWLSLAASYMHLAERAMRNQRAVQSGEPGWSRFLSDESG